MEVIPVLAGSVLERNEGDQSLAFQEFIHLLRHIAKHEKLI
jgi:hypothetical protein